MGNSENIELTNRPSQENSQNVEMRHSGTSGNADANADVDTNAPPAVFSVTASNQDANANDILNSNQGRGQGLANNASSPRSVDSASSNSVISLDELKYGYSSYHAICTPVSITMILSALAVIYIQSEREANEEAVSDYYTIFDVSNAANSNAKNFGLSLINGLVIIAVIAAATFLIVLLYKYRCMKLLKGYMIFSSAALLGMLGGVMFQTFIQRYHVVMDQITFYFLLVNFAVVGTAAIFYGKGIPSFITQMYLVFTSVILAWQLSFFNEWTAWMLLVLLALYDLCAVLTPCGPLKALVNLMQRDDAPEMPGLLYEARLPDGVDRPGRGSRRGATNNSNSGNGNVIETNGTPASSESGTNTQTSASRARPSASSQANANSLEQQSALVTPNPAAEPSEQVQVPTHEHSSDDEISAVLPFAIAKIYKLPIASEGCPQFVVDKYRPRSDPPVRSEYAMEELLTEVNVFFPRHGGKVIMQPPEMDETNGNGNGAPRWRRRDGSNLPRYIVLDRQGEVKRVLVLNEDGKVFEEVQGERNGDDSGPSSSQSNSIKLGLGDFIFYSVLVAKAALNSFTTFAACMLVILAGLGGTLILLSVYHSALPALPISIFLGVIFYFTTKALIEPWIETILFVPFYV